MNKKREHIVGHTVKIPWKRFNCCSNGWSVLNELKAFGDVVETDMPLKVTYF